MSAMRTQDYQAIPRARRGVGWPRRWTLLVVALGLLAATCRCEETPVVADAGDGAPPDARLDAGVDAEGEAGLDARPDAEVPPDAVQHDFCDQPYFKLPIDGQTERTGGIEISGTRIAWSKRTYPSDQMLGEVYLLDIVTCIERQLTTNTEAGWVDIHGNDIVWDDRKDGRDPWCTELRHYDLIEDVEDRLTETTECELEPKTNGRYVAYRRKDTTSDPTSLRLLDRQSGTDIELSPDWTNIESFDINDSYVVWVAYTQDSQSVGRDVLYHDLQTGQTHHLDATYPRYQYWVFLWNDWVTIRGSDAHLSGPKFLGLYNLSTQQERSLLEGDWSVGSGPIDRSLVVWNTSEYTGSQSLFPADMVLYDIRSMDTRRLTTSAGNVAPTAIASPYLLYIHFLFLSSSRFQNDFYVANLEALGVLDATGSLLSGGPVITPP